MLSNEETLRLGAPLAAEIGQMEEFQNRVFLKLEQQMDAIEQGDYEKANAIGSLVNNMLLMAISFNLKELR